MKKLSEMRGLSDPYFFGFTTLDDKAHTMVSHGVCFISLVMKGSDKISLMDEEKDPRAKELIGYIWRNHLKEKKKDLEKMLQVLNLTEEEFKALLFKIETTKEKPQ